MGFALGGSFVWGVLYNPPSVKQGPAEQTKHANGTLGDAKNQNAKPGETRASVPPIPSDDLTGKSADHCQQCPTQPDKEWWDRVWTDPNATFAGAVAFFTLALVIVGAWQARRLRQTVEATENAAAETRRIGETQTRAYVDIATAMAIFLDMPGLNDVQPLVRIVAKNTGQSPARNFVWNTAIQYFSLGEVGRSIEGQLGGNWREIRGAGIPVGGEHVSGALVTGMLLLKFLRADSGPDNVVMIRVRVQFEFEDVFNEHIVNEAFFMGTASKMPDGKSVRTDYGDTQWGGQIHRIERPSDW
jgi:hypothetical protein